MANACEYCKDKGFIETSEGPIPCPQCARRAALIAGAWKDTMKAGVDAFNRAVDECLKASAEMRAAQQHFIAASATVESVVKELSAKVAHIIPKGGKKA